MKFATLVLTHAEPELTADTVDSIETWVGDRVMVLVDQVGWPLFQNARLGGARIEQGFLHAYSRGPYRNYALGLKKMYEAWPDSDWFISTEYDVLFLSDGFKSDLAVADKLNAWCAGVDLRRFPFQLPLLETLLACGPIRHSYYLLGCCLFFSRRCLERMHETGFLDKLLEATKGFSKGYFPGNTRWSVDEELWPTAAVHLGGSLLELACWTASDREWHPRIGGDPHLYYAEGKGPHWRGCYPRYTLRFRPQVGVADLSPEASVIHPVKRLDDPIRMHNRLAREARRNNQPPLRAEFTMIASPTHLELRDDP